MTKVYIVKTESGSIETFTTMSFPYPNNVDETISVIFNELNQHEAIYLELNSEIDIKVRNYINTKGTILEEINIVLEDAIRSMLERLRN